MYSQIRTSMLDGICALPVQVEVDISMGMPVFDMVGYLSPEVREAKERVRTALHNLLFRRIILWKAVWCRGRMSADFLHWNR